MHATEIHRCLQLHSCLVSTRYTARRSESFCTHTSEHLRSQHVQTDVGYAEHTHSFAAASCLHALRYTPLSLVTCEIDHAAQQAVQIHHSRRSHSGHLHAPALHRHGNDKHPPVVGPLCNSYRLTPACAPEPPHRPLHGSGTPSVPRDRSCGHTSSTKVFGSYTSHTCCHALLEFMNACPAERRTRVVAHGAYFTQTATYSCGSLLSRPTHSGRTTS